MKLPLVVMPNDELPLYLQLKYQLIYLINSQQLPNNFKFPAVQELAKELGINPGTIVRAYKELQAAGLIHAIQGKGTFVKVRSANKDEKQKLRQDLLVQELQHVRRRAFSLGFDDLEVEQWMKSIRGANDCCREVAFVSFNSLPTASKYARIIENHFNNISVKVKVNPVTLDQLDDKKDKLLEFLDPVYYIITLVNLVHNVEESLMASSHRCEIVGVSTEHSSETVERLASLPSNTKACLVIPERSLHRVLSVVEQHSDLDSESLPFAFVSNLDIVEKVASEADVVIHTDHAIETLDQLHVEPSKRLEIHYEVTTESFEKLTKLFISSNRANRS